MADQERKEISIEDEFVEELGVVVSFLDPHLKAREETKKAGPFAPWSARKALFFFLFAATSLWLAVLAMVYLLFLVF